MICTVSDFGAVPNTEELQTKAFQAAFDAVRGEGGTVEVPAGRYVVSGLQIYSDTVLHLAENAVLCGSRDCSAYALIPLPDGMELRTDVEMIPQYDSETDRTYYRRAILSAYGASNISVIGETGSCIDGQDCYDAEGEEHYRGPHGIFFSCCTNVLLRGYTITSTGNFMHQFDQCTNVTFSGVTMLAGHDGAHIHCCTDVLFDSCVIRSGDDCIAGIDTRNVTIRRCELNTSCNNLRIGGVNLLVEDCRFVGPGIYPHRLSVPHGPEDHPPVSAGRHNTLCAINYFSSEIHPASGPACNWLIRNCLFRGVDRFLLFLAGDAANIHSGVPLIQMRLENVKMEDLLLPSLIQADPQAPLYIETKNVSYGFRAGSTAGGELFPEQNESFRVVSF